MKLPLVFLALSILRRSTRGYSVTSRARATLSSPLFQPRPVVAPSSHTVAPLKQSSVAINGDATAAASLNKFSSAVTRVGLMSFILSMCVALPVTLVPQQLVYKAGLVTKVQSERMALATGQFCARWLMRLIPFVDFTVKSSIDGTVEPEPSIWVSNHISMLDVFVLLATDLKLRGKKKRPIKIVYWKGLESNPVTKLLFQQCGFISVDMADNGHGTDNEYDMKSFRTLLKETKRAFDEGFDIGILPEGQINPTPAQGLLPIFTGAYTLARMSKRPIQMLALNGIQELWHPTEGMICTNRQVNVRAYPSKTKPFESSNEFEETFTAVVGYFGQYGSDIPTWKKWMDGSRWKEMNQEEPSATS